jgi:hypothetical protein
MLEEGGWWEEKRSKEGMDKVQKPNGISAGYIPEGSDSLEAWHGAF